jgi:hypothetical protein
MKHLTRWIAAATAGSALAVAGLTAAAPAANADSACPLTNACVFSYNSLPNRPPVRIFISPNTVSNINKTVGADGGYVYNDGQAQQGADHLQVFARKPDGSRVQACLHYGPSPVFRQQGTNTEATAIFLDSSWTVTNWYWRGECTPAQNQWNPA